MTSIYHYRIQVYEVKHILGETKIPQTKIDECLGEFFISISHIYYHNYFSNITNNFLGKKNVSTNGYAFDKYTFIQVEDLWNGSWVQAPPHAKRSPVFCVEQ